MIHAFVLLCFSLLVGVFGDTGEVKTVSVMEGESLTLHTDTHIQRDHEIVWRFENNCIATIKRQINSNPTYNKTFTGSLELNNQTGDLTITNIRSDHTGVYELRIIIGNTPTSKSFRVTVYVPLPVPVISSSRSHCSNSTCVLLCSVMNVTHVTLSWYKGNSLFSSISVSDLNIRLSLPLEVEDQDNNTYSCVLNNPIRNQTQHLNITDVCQCSDQSRSFTHLVLHSAAGSLMIVATVQMFWIYRKHRHTHQQDRSGGEENTYAETRFSTRPTHKPRSSVEDEVVHAGASRR